MDFSIDIKPKFPRKQRRALAHIAKKCVNESVKKLELSFSKPFKGRNESRMYNVEIEYNSLIFEDKGTPLNEVKNRLYFVTNKKNG